MKIDRRRVLRTTAALLTGSLLLPELAKETGRLTLVDGTLSEGELRGAGASVMTNARAIRPDLVRQWRDGLGAQIAAAEAVMAYVRWDKALVLVGLARESRMDYRTEQVGRSVFVVSLSMRG